MVCGGLGGSGQSLGTPQQVMQTGTEDEMTVVLGTGNRWDREQTHLQRGWCLTEP